MSNRDYNFYILDTETTGLNPERDKLLSVAMIKLSGFNPIEDIEVVINHDEFYHLEMHDKNGLNKRVQESKITLEQAEEILCSFVDSCTRNVLIGNSIHFDRGFIAKYMPNLSVKFHFRMLDVSSINLLVRYINPELAHKVYSNKKYTHTALSDCYETLEEFKLYFNKLKG